ncbi:hypothetical protein ACFV2S_25100 [Streptomyces sp. NPDC059695]|uniref:hypothetical protein n=1 Tax=Streptomyces sp. NPDC059695 TaxID=3346910 RepID=UPI0036BAEF14
MTYPLDDRRPLGTEWLVAIICALLLVLGLLVARGAMSSAQLEELLAQLIGAALAALALRVVDAKA